ncbi:MAG: hypothetical protein JXA74_02090 [Anaerolineae bacterium]|nr:hypothetical protein [Anaerolineae bacterium]
MHIGKRSRLWLVWLGLLVGLGWRALAGAPAAAQSPRPSYRGLSFYWGDLHAHSGYSSDGVGTPEQAYDSARQRHNDFFALTDHDHAYMQYPYLCLDGVDNSLAGTPDFECRPDQLVYVDVEVKWAHLKEVAASRGVPGEFVALYGYEWTHTGGHINVLQAPNFVRMGLTLPTFLDALPWHPDHDAFILMLNHPYEGYDFDDFAYHPEASPLFHMIETNRFAGRYPEALKAGWPVGATGYGDNHYGFESGTRRYGVLAADLTEESITQALKGRQTFGVLEGRAGEEAFPLAAALSVNGALMGGRTPHNGAFEYEIYVRDDLQDITRVRLLYGGAYPADYYVAREFRALGREALLRGRFGSPAFDMPDRAEFVYVEVWQYDREARVEEAVAWTAPVWLTYDPAYVPSPTPSPTATPEPTPTPTPTPPYDAVHLPLILTRNSSHEPTSP